MPLYELLALGVPRLPKSEVARIIQRLGRAVYDRGGVVTNVKSYGEQPLAYKIRGTSGKYDQVSRLLGGRRSLLLSPAARALSRPSPPPPPQTHPTQPPTTQAHIWQLDFAVAPQALADLRHELRVDERLLRWAVVKRRAAPRLPAPRQMYHHDPSFGAVLRPEAGRETVRVLPDVSALFEEESGRASGDVVASSSSFPSPGGGESAP